MKLPRDLSGPDLARSLQILGYTVTRQRGSHMRVTTSERGTHHETIPAHSPIKVGTLRSILRSIASHHRVSVEELCSLLHL